MSPALGGVKPSMSSSNVVLPAPFLPSTPTTSPGDTWKDRSSSTRFAPKDLLRCAACTIASFIAILPITADALHQFRLAEFELFGREHRLLHQRLNLLQAPRQRRSTASLGGHGHGLAAIA